MNSENIMKRATQRDKKLGFRIHALVFVPSIVLIVAIDLFTGPPYWSAWPVLGWSVGLLCHWFFVLGPGARNAANASRDSA